MTQQADCLFNGGNIVGRMLACQNMPTLPTSWSCSHKPSQTHHSEFVGSADESQPFADSSCVRKLSHSASGLPASQRRLWLQQLQQLQQQGLHGSTLRSEGAKDALHLDHVGPGPAASLWRLGSACRSNRSNRSNIL